MTITKPAAICLALAMSCAPAMAVEHAETGLRVELDDDFVIDETPLERPNYDVVYGINAASGEPPIVGTGEHLCEIGFQTAPQNADLTQDEINAMIAEPGWPKMAQRSMASIFDFNGAVPFELDGITGYEFIGTPKMGPDAADVRIVMSMLETPLGRTVVTCAATAGTIEQANTVFRTIRDGVTPPR